jgi:hypothetical protein
MGWWAGTYLQPLGVYQNGSESQQYKSNYCKLTSETAVTWTNVDLHTTITQEARRELSDRKLMGVLTGVNEQ